MIRSGLALKLCLAATSAAQIHINIHNNAGIAIEDLQRAGGEAERILQSAGVSLMWLDCRPLEPGSEPCISPGPATLQLRIYPASAEAKFRVASDALGFALSSPPPKHGFFVGIFHARVAAVARSARIEVGQLLGHAIAHEVGHLLMGGGGHAAGGIMKSPWRRKELVQIQRGELRFLRKQAGIIRANVEARRGLQGL